ncbi:MAG: arginine decarboxylase, partial [Gammaproteobacteria bacterium]
MSVSNDPIRSTPLITTGDTIPEDIYNIAYWGDGYFSVSDDGNLHITLPEHHKNATPFSADIATIVEACQAKNLRLPLLIRITNILRHRVQRLCQAFQHAFDQLAIADGRYTAIYPIKVNQHKHVVDEILAGARDAHPIARVGLEAGSKPEFIAAFASLPDPSTLLICNGYKDEEYLSLAVNLVPLCEKAGISPNLGIRVRLHSTGKGNWQNTGGDKGKFGLTAPQLLQLIGQLKQKSWLSNLQLLHVHIGSQISDIQDVARCLTEVGRYLIELKRLGAPCTYLDVGGGLGVDYEGTASDHYHSINYSMEEYALTVTRVLNDVCTEAGITIPHLLTESGRALTAHHAVLLTHVVDREQHSEFPPDVMIAHAQATEPSDATSTPATEHPILHTLAELCTACRAP